jgi:hypothetical protein
LPSSLPTSIIRLRQRTTYHYPLFQIDLTIINGKEYEFEVELKIPATLSKNQGNLRNAIDELLKLYNWILDKIRELMQRQPVYPILSQAHNLRFPDLVYGGIVGNAKTDYVVGLKADGYRRYLRISPLLEKGSISSIPGTVQIQLLDERTRTVIFSSTVSLAQGIELKQEYILEVEDIPVQNRKNGAPSQKYWVLAYDNLSLSQEPYLDRHLSLQAIFPTPLITADIVIEVKPIYRLTYANFFVTLREILAQKPNFVTDGVIFTPLNLTYAESTSWQAPDKQRYLSIHPDICKWKPDITIDLEVTNEGKLVSQGKLLEDIARPILNSSPELVAKLYNPLDFIQYANKVVEVSPRIIASDDLSVKTQNIAFIFTRTRPDKNEANAVSVIEDNLRLTIDPILQTTLEGRDTALLRKYHNRIKNSMFHSINQTEDTILLDIGSGDGQDVMKWKNARIIKIYAVEPDAKHLEELKKRVKQAKMELEVTIIPARGQDTDKILSYIPITSPKPNTVVLMLSLTFFWENKEVLRGLVRTLLEVANENAPIYFFTLDGDRLVQGLNSSFNSLEFPRVAGDPFNSLEFPRVAGDPFNPNGLKGDNINLQLNNEQVTIDIEGSHVRAQKEWLVHLNDLILILNEGKNCCYQLKQYFYADREYLLPPTQFKLSSFYTFGVIAKKYYNPLKNMASLPVPKPLPAKLEPIKRAVVPLVPTITVSITQPPVPSTPSLPVPQAPVPVPSTPSLPVPQAPVPVPSTPSLPVPPAPSVPIQAPILKLPLIGEENRAPIVGTSLIRTGTIADGNCFVHAFLRAIDPIYRNKNSEDRRIYVRLIRNSLADLLGARDRFLINAVTDLLFDLSPGAPMYSATPLVNIEGIGQDVTGLPFTMNLENLQNYLRSNGYLGEEIMQLFAWIYDINIVILAGRQDKTRFINQISPVPISTSPSNPYSAEERYLGIIWIESDNPSSCHYDLITNTQGKAIFNFNDPAVKEMLQLSRKK